MRAFRHTCPVLFLFAGATLHAQEPVDTTHRMKEVVITANRLDNFAAGTKVQQIDSATMGKYPMANLGDVLTNESSVFIKSYGAGSLATTSFRGGSASHTAVLWNGFNLNNPMNGQLDLSLLPGDFAGSITLQYGGTSALWGSGAVGGAILLNSSARFDQGLNVSLGSSVGSFGDYRQKVFVQLSQRRWISSLKVLHTTAKNDFVFYKPQINGASLERQPHAELKQSGVLSENYFYINDFQKLTLCFWYQTADRNIPPTLLQDAGIANQKDESYRLTSEWRRTTNKNMLAARVGYFDERLTYSDVYYATPALSRSHTLISEVEWKVNVGNYFMLNTGMNATWEKAQSDGYPDALARTRLAGFASFQYRSQNEKLAVVLSGREELVNGKPVPFTFSLGSNLALFKWLSLYANGARVYRIPTFNDLYWNPGGNPSLLPESGYSAEAGASTKLQLHRDVVLASSVTVFTRFIDNWILWLPGPGYWSPQNIMKVWSRGMETNTELNVTCGKVKINLGVATNYVLSTNEETRMVNDASVGRQLIYVPMYSGHAKAGIAYRNFSCSWLQNYTGYRYTSTDNYEYLEPFTLANVYASYQFIRSRFQCTVFARCNNVFNVSYQVLLNRAMPLRNYQAGVAFQFQRPNKSKHATNEN